MAKLVGARVYNSADISINNITYTNLTFDSERYDTDSIHSTVANTGRLTCQTAGKYQIGATIRFEENVTGRRIVYIRVNETPIAYEARNAVGDAAVATGITINAQADLSVTDYVEIRVYQSSGGALDVDNSNNYSPEFWMHRIG